MDSSSDSDQILSGDETCYISDPEDVDCPAQSGDETCYISDPEDVDCPAQPVEEKRAFPNFETKEQGESFVAGLLFCVTGVYPQSQIDDPTAVARHFFALGVAHGFGTDLKE